MTAPRVCKRLSIAAAGTRCGLTLWRSSLRADCTRMLRPGSRGRTHFAPFGRCVQTTAASLITKRAARADPGPALLADPHSAPTGHRLPRGQRLCRRGEQPRRFGKGAFGQAVARLCGAEERRACGLARSAIRHLTRCACSSAARAKRARSELRDGPQARAPQGSRRAATTAAPKRHGLPGRAFAALNRRAQSTPAKPATSRQPPLNTPARHPPCTQPQPGRPSRLQISNVKADWFSA